MTISGEPSTPLERAQHIANLFGGNGLSQTQQNLLIAEKLTQWSRSDCFAAADIMDPCNGKTPREVIEPLVWYKKDGWDHGGSAVTWREQVEELKVMYEGEAAEAERRIERLKAALTRGYIEPDTNWDYL